MNRSLIVAGVALALVAGGLAYAQPDRRYNPLEDFLGRIGRDNTNRPLDCQVIRRLGRDGDIVYLRMECHARRGIYGR